MLTVCSTARKKVFTGTLNSRYQYRGPGLLKKIVGEHKQHTIMLLSVNIQGKYKMAR